MKKALLAVALSAVLLAACGDDQETEAEPQQPAATATETPAQEGTDPQTLAEEITKDLDTAPEIPAPAGPPPAELQTIDIVEGKGKRAKEGDTAVMQYVGHSWSTGQKFDASWDRGEPFEFPLGAGRVIGGWDQGIVGMREGGRRLLVIPPDLGYGPQGSPPAIAPNETLLFVVDLEKVR